MHRRLSIFACVALCLCVGKPVAWGQMTTATIFGTVKDTSEAVLPGVQVIIRNTQTGITRAVTTDGQGRYTATSLPLGNYEVQAELQGFQTAVRSGLELTVGRVAVVHLVLEVGSVTERIVVQGEAPLVDTTSSTVGGLVDTQQIADLPINARSYDKLARLEVGVALVRSGGPSASGAVGGNMDRISIGGGRVTENLFLLDGTDISDKRGVSPGGSSGSALGMEAIREFRILTSNYGAQYGRTGGGIVEVVTKSGTNELHGSAFHYLRNDNLDARNFFDPDEPPEFKRNQFGASLGGPVIKNKTFFFGNYEGLRERLGRTQTATVPDDDARRGILGGRSVPVAESVKPYLALYPLPNGRIFGNGTGEFRESVSQSTTQDYFVVRGDHQFTENHSLMGRFTFDDSDVIGPHNPAVSSGVSASRSEIVTLENTSIFTPQLLNKLRFGLNRSVTADRNEPHNIPSTLDWVPGQGLLTSGQLVVRGLPSLGGNRFLPNGFAWNSFQWADDLSYVRGGHSLKIGGVVQRIQYNHKGSESLSLEYVFNSLELLLQGRTQSLIATSEGTRNRWLRQTLVGVYLQDDFTVRSNLTLNLGVRLEFITSPTEKFGQASNLRDVLDTQLTIGNPLFESPKNNWAPRVGFAWDPTGQGRFSLRGGFGMFHIQPVPTYWYIVAQHNPPFVVLANLASPPFPNGWELAKAVGAADLSRQETRSFHYTGTGYSMRYNLTMQAELREDMVAMVGYMGTQARKLIRRGQANTKLGVILPDGRKFFPPEQPKRNPLLGDVERLENDVTANYNGLVAALRRRISGGLQFQASYTFAKALSIQDTIPGAELSGGRLQLLDDHNWRRDRGPAEHDIRQTFVLSSTYEPPFGRNLTGGARHFFSGWQLGGIATLTSGNPLSADSSFLAGDGTLSTRGLNRADLAPGGKSNPILGGPDLYFDPLQFQVTQPGFYGNVGRNTLTGPGMVMVDLSLAKRNSLTETLQLQFRAEFFNVLNRPNFDRPSNNLFDGTGRPNLAAGQIRSTRTSARQIQFGLRLIF